MLASLNNAIIDGTVRSKTWRFLHIGEKDTHVVNITDTIDKDAHRSSAWIGNGP